MTRRLRFDNAWRALVGLFTEVLNPLVVIWLALFVCLGYMLTLLMPVQIAHWTALLIATLLLPLAGLLLRFWVLWRAGAYASLTFDSRALLPLLPLLVFVPLFQAELTSPTLQVMGHIDIHAGYTNQLRFSTTPPENVYVAGHPANYYWLFHAPLAALVELTKLPLPLLVSLLNTVAILMSFFVLADILVALGLAKRRTLWLGFAIVLVYCALNSLGPPTMLGRLLAGDVETRVTQRLMLLPGADRRLHDVMSKMLNYNSMALAMLCFITALHIVLRFLRDRIDRLALILLSACVAVCLAIRPEAALYIVVALVGGLALAGIALGFDKRAHACRPQTLVTATIGRLQPRFILMWLVASAGLTAPLLQYIFGFASNHEGNIWIEPTSYYNVLMLLAALQLFLPLFLIQTWLSWRDRRWMIWFLQCSGLIGLILAAVLRLPDYGQYKFVFFLSILFALSGLLALQNLARQSGSRLSKAARLLTICLVALAFLKIAVVKVSTDIDAAQWEFAYDGNHILFLDGYTSPQRLAAYTWIREHTPFDAIVVAPPYLAIYEYVLSERQIYVRDRHNHYSRYIEDWYDRNDHMLQLYGYEPLDQSYSDLLAAMRAQLPGRDLYVVLADSDVAPAAMLGAGAEMVYEDDQGGAHVYLLNPLEADA
ncbi:MAG: hypothetical protein OXE46_12660 [Chloroflexi bacterium]|nr:hypothetical protein [Chloroflexota bacterium]